MQFLAILVLTSFAVLVPGAIIGKELWQLKTFVNLTLSRAGSIVQYREAQDRKRLRADPSYLPLPLLLFEVSPMSLFTTISMVRPHFHACLAFTAALRS